MSQSAPGARPDERPNAAAERREEEVASDPRFCSDSFPESVFEMRAGRPHLGDAARTAAAAAPPKARSVLRQSPFGITVREAEPLFVRTRSR